MKKCRGKGYHRWQQAAIIAASQISAGFPANADVTMTTGTGITVFDFTCFSTKHCPAMVPVDAAGAPMTGTAGNPTVSSSNALTVQSITLGNGTSTNAARVTLSNDSTGVVNATQSGTWNITNISGTISLPTGAATLANQAVVNTWASSTLGPMANYGTSPGAVLVPGVNAFVTNAADPCNFQAKTNVAINQSGTASVQLVGLSGATSIYVCSLSLVAAGATTMAITTGTSTACAASNVAVIGSTSSNVANSISFAANGGMTLGSGNGTVAKGAASSELCMILGSNVFVSGNLTYVQQ